MKKTMFFTVLLGLLFASTAVAVEPGDTLWARTYGGIDSDYGECVQQTTDGGFIVAAWTFSFGAGSSDFYLLKTDANGDTLWTRTYGGSDGEEASSVAQTADGGFIIAGGTGSFGAGRMDVYLVRTDADGDTLWTRAYGGSASEFGLSVQQTTDGGYIVGGYTESFGAGSSDCYLLKTDANGDTVWTRTYGGSADEYAESVQQTTDGGYVIAGWTFDLGDYDVYLIKTDANGDTLWTRTYGGANDEFGVSVQQTADEGYIIAGYSARGWVSDVYLVRTDANGDELWTRTYGGSGADYGESVEQTEDGGYIVVGEIEISGHWHDVYLVKTDANGDTLWTRVYGGTAWDFGHFVQQTADGGYVVAGITNSFGAGFQDVWLLRVAGEQPAAVSIEIVPDDPPVTVPQGGSFGFSGTLTNNTDQPQLVDAGTMAIGPEKGVYGWFKKMRDLELEPYEILSAHFDQHVNDRAPLGVYTYIAYCGDYPSTVIDSSFFQIEVVAGISGSGEDLGWLLSGSFDGSDESSGLPSEFALLSNYPNPFNASTVIEYQLPEASEVTLQVYNLLGEKVATLVDSKQQAGYRSVVWDASEVSSGLYFYKLTAGDFTETKRMMLVK